MTDTADSSAAETTETTESLMTNETHTASSDAQQPALIPDPDASSPQPETAAAAEDPSPVLPQRPRESPVDPRVAALRALFPDFDDALLQSVLESVGGNQERAIDVLLGMSDPDYKETQPQAVPLSQSDLDEQLAHRLYMDEQAAWQVQEQYQHPSWRAPVQQVQEKDTMAEIGDQINKFAESSKKTLGNLFTKVKAKISEFEQGRQSQATWGVGGDTYPYDTGENPYPSSGQAPYIDQSRQNHGVPSTTGAPTGGYDTAPIEPSAAYSTPSVPTSPTPIDTGKIGLLPKRPVSLLQTQPPQETTQNIADESDELEYAENPFEEGKK